MMPSMIIDNNQDGQDSHDTLEAMPERVRTIATLRGLGFSFREIGGHFGVTPQAISVMLSRHRRMLGHIKSSPELHGLSARAVNVLARHGIRSREQARRTDAMLLLRSEKNCGVKTLEEIRRWMGEGRFLATEDSRLCNAVGHA